MSETRFYFIYFGIFEWKTTDINQNSVGLLLACNAARWQHKPKRDREENLVVLLFSRFLERSPTLRTFLSSTESQYQSHSMGAMKVIVGTINKQRPI